MDFSLVDLEVEFEHNNAVQLAGFLAQGGDVDHRYGIPWQGEKGSKTSNQFGERNDGTEKGYKKGPASTIFEASFL